VSFVPRNGTFRTPAIAVHATGYYQWVVRTSADAANPALRTGPRQASLRVAVVRPNYGPVQIDTADGAYSSHAGSAAPRLGIPSLGISAPTTSVGMVGHVMTVPENTATAGWLRNSAAPGEAFGTTIIAGHVSDVHDSPGALWRLHDIARGAIVTVADSSGKVYRYRVTRKFYAIRPDGLPKSLFTTRGANRLALVTCAVKVLYPNGHFHYTMNLVVIAKPVT
jgi:hypothetical protein